MKQLKDYRKVRRMYFVQKLSMREITRRTGVHRNTIKKMIEQGAPLDYERIRQPKPMLGPFMPIVDRILKDDLKMPRKQRHTAKRIWERLRDEHNYTGGYTQVRVYVKKAKIGLKDRFVPLEFDPGVAQVDWGEAWASDRGARRKVYLFVMTLPVSGARFVAAFPRATQEFFLEGHWRSFEFFGGVPTRIIYDNLKSAVDKVLRGRDRKLNRTFVDFSEHYLFEPSFCNVASGNEKGHVESGVKWAQRSLMTPLPEFVDWRSLNRRLDVLCRRKLTQAASSNGPTVAQALDEERSHFRPIPTVQPKKGRPRPTSVNSLSLVHFDTNTYSVPCEFAHHKVTVEADVCEVRIHRHGYCIARHDRCHDKGQAIYDPIHYLPLIERKPRALDDGAPMKRLELPECFDTLRRRLEADQQYSRGTREYIRILRMLERQPLGRLARAVERCLDLGVVSEEAVRHLVLCPPERTPTVLDLKGRGHLAIHIPPPNPALYTELSQGGAA